MTSKFSEPGESSPEFSSLIPEIPLKGLWTQPWETLWAKIPELPQAPFNPVPKDYFLPHPCTLWAGILTVTASPPMVLAESSGEESVELRQHRRYRLSAPVSFSWESREGAVGTGEGHTRDISIAGVFVLTPDLIPEGSLVRMDVNLPPVTAKSQPVYLRSQGRVTRVEDNGFAAIAPIGFRMHFRGVSKAAEVV
jgi:PilZ domain